MSTEKIEITLSAANMGPEATEQEFDAWASYVAANIDEALAIDAAVDQFAFTGRGAASEDRIVGGDPGEHEAVARWLSVDGWEAFCAAGGPAGVYPMP